MSKEEKREKLLERLRSILMKQAIKKLIEEIIDKLSNMDQLLLLNNNEFKKDLGPLLQKLFPYNENEYEELENIDGVFVELVKEFLAIYKENGAYKSEEGIHFDNYKDDVWINLNLEKFIKPELKEKYRLVFDNMIEEKIRLDG